MFNLEDFEVFPHLKNIIEVIDIHNANESVNESYWICFYYKAINEKQYSTGKIYNPKLKDTAHHQRDCDQDGCYITDYFDSLDKILIS